MLGYFTGKRLFPWRKHFLRKFARLVLPPEGSGLPTPESINLVEAIEAYIAGLHLLLRLGMMGLIEGCNLLAIFFGYLLPFSWLPESWARRYLARMENHSVYLIRNIFVATKALVMNIYYGDPRVEALLGYKDDCLDESKENVA